MNTKTTYVPEEYLFEGGANAEVDAEVDAE